MRSARKRLKEWLLVAIEQAHGTTNTVGAIVVCSEVVSRPFSPTAVREPNPDPYMSQDFMFWRSELIYDSPAKQSALDSFEAVGCFRGGHRVVWTLVKHRFARASETISQNIGLAQHSLSPNRRLKEPSDLQPQQSTPQSISAHAVSDVKRESRPRKVADTASRSCHHPKACMPSQCVSGTASRTLPVPLVTEGSDKVEVLCL
jgi:hypothetical protein